MAPPSSSSKLRQRRTGKSKDTSKARNDPNERDESSKKKQRSIVWSSALRNIAIWRIVFFGIMTFYELGKPQVLPPFGTLQIESGTPQSRVGKDRWFAYQHLYFVQDLHAWIGSNPDVARVANMAGYGLGFLAMTGKELGIPGWRVYTTAFTALYSLQFWTRATNFTNHNYLFALLMVLSILSGGGHLSGEVVLEEDHDDEEMDILTNRRAPPNICQVKACEAAIVALRAQFAILYGFASLWKFHPDWFAGIIVRSIFLSFQEQDTSRGIAWSELEKSFPWIFEGLAISGLLLDASMFTVLAFARPCAATRNMFMAFTSMFHVFTTITMGKVIGYSFPGTCLAGLAVFLPLCVRKAGASHLRCYDKTLLEWVRTFWNDTVGEVEKGKSGDLAQDSNSDDYDADTDEQYGSSSIPRIPRLLQFCVLSWIFWQVLMPLRMLTVSRFSFPRTRLGYRYSWTMMLHSIDAGLVRDEGKENQSVLLFSYIVPTCFHPTNPLADQFMPRQAYFGANSDHPMQDSRTVPLYQILDKRESATLEVFPLHLVSSVAAGFARVIDQHTAKDVCQQQIPGSTQKRMGMHGVSFARLNNRGPFTRIMDPTIDLVKTIEEQEQLSVIQGFWNALWEKRPNDFVLSGAGSSRSLADRHQQELEVKYPGTVVTMIADRAACLQRRPLWLRPMVKVYMLVPLLLPKGNLLRLKSQRKPEEGETVAQFDYYDLDVGSEPAVFQTLSAEVGLSGVAEETECGHTTEEDVIFALIYNK